VSEKLRLRDEVISAHRQIGAVMEAIRAWDGLLVDSDDVPRFCDAFDAYFKAFARFLRVYNNVRLRRGHSKAIRVEWNAVWLLFGANFQRVCAIMETLADGVNQEIAIIRRLREESGRDGVDRSQ
jgi:hypothetical protein